MTGIPYRDYIGDLGPQSAQGQAEFSDFLRRRAELLKVMMDEGVASAHAQSHVSSVAPPTNQPIPLTGRPSSSDELIAQARAWQIPNPESIDPRELQHQIQQRRDNVPRDQQTSLSSVGYALAGAASEAAASTTRVLGNVLGLVEKTPFAGALLDSVVGQQGAKNWMYDLSQKAQTASEIAGMQQPASDLSAYQFLTGAGKMAGYALPAIATWNGLSALGAYAPVAAWAGRIASPIARAAIQGGLTSAVLEGGSDDSGAQKATSIALGAALGGAAGVGGRVATSIGFGTVGAGIGAMTGQTEADRTRHAIEFGLGAAALPIFAPVLARAFMKVTQDISSPFDQKFAEASARQAQELPRLSAPVMNSDGTQAGQPQIAPQAPKLLLRSDSQGETIDFPGLEQPTTPSIALATQPAGSPSRNPTDLSTPGFLQSTKVTGSDGRALTVYHAQTDDTGNLPFGAGFYTAENPVVATAMSNLGGQQGAPTSIRQMRLDIRNPFETDKQFSQADVASLIQKLQDKSPGFKWDETHNMLDHLATNNMQREPTNVDGATLYNILAETPNTSGSAALGRAGINAALESAGYDGISHVVNTPDSQGQKLWIAFRPEQIHSPFDLNPLPLHEAAAQGIQMSKQASVLESAVLPDALNRTKIDDSDVAASMVSANPAGASLIKGVQADQQVISKMLYEHPGIQFVQREGRLDALLGGATAGQASEYAQHGIFSGQEIHTADGIRATVLDPHSSSGMVSIQPEGSGVPQSISRDKVLPGRFGVNKEAPQLYEAFREDLLSQVNRDTESAQMAPITDMTDPRVGSVISSHMNNFLDRLAIHSPAERQIIEADFNHRWTDEFSGLVPESSQIQNQAVDRLAISENARESSSDAFPVSLSAKAQSRGFIWLSQPGEGGTLRDLVNPEGALEIPVSTDQAAHTFLEHVDRVLPDLTPAADTPAEVMQVQPSESMIEPTLMAEDHAEHLSNSLAALENEGTDTGLGGSGQPPRQPPTGGHIPFDPGQPRIPSETLAGQFSRLRKADPVRVQQMLERFDGVLGQKVMYTRYGMLNLESKLADMGVDMGRAWKHFDDLALADTLAVNEGSPFIQQWAEITRQFNQKALRDGSVMRIHEIEDPNARTAAIWRLQESHGLSDSKIQDHLNADGQISDFMDRLFTRLGGNPDSERALFKYIAETRTRQEQGLTGDDAFRVDDQFSDVQWFAQHARDGNIQFKQLDARTFGNYLVRAGMFKEYKSEPWSNLVDSWELNKPMVDWGSSIPLQLRQYMHDYAHLNRYGYDPSSEIAVQGIKAVFDVVGIPVTAREAQHMLNIPRGLQYMALLAGRSSIFFRDAVQPLFALSKVEIPFMQGVYHDVLRGRSENTLRAMYQRGIQGGWIQRENPNLEAAGMFEEQTGLGSTNELASATPDQLARREVLASIGDKFAGLPNWLVRPQESVLNTLKWYGREGQLHRLITGESAFRQTVDKLAEYRRSIVSSALGADPSLAMSYDDFAKKSFFSSFEQPIQRQLQMLVSSGDDEGAASLFARQVSDWSQFRYGRKEQPPVLRGQAGSWAFTFSNYSGQALAMMNSALRNGAASHKARALMTFGAISAALKVAKNETGWSFDKWGLGDVLAYTGGPLVDKMIQDVQVGRAAMNVSADRPVSEEEAAAVNQATRQGLLPGLGDINPYAGYFKSAGELMSASEGSHPIEQAARFSITGDRGSSIDMHRELERLAAQQDSVQTSNQNHQAFPHGALSPNGGLMNQQVRPGSHRYGAPPLPGGGAQQ